MRRPVGRVLEDRRHEVARISSAAGDDTIIDGLIYLDGVGLFEHEVDFPVRFIERPLFSDGYELDENMVFSVSEIPDVRGVVWRWTLGYRDGTGDPYFDGATFAIKVEGPSTQKGFYHWQMRGKALNNPAGR